MDYFLNHVEDFGLQNPSTCFRHGGGNGAHALLDKNKIQNTFLGAKGGREICYARLLHTSAMA